METINPTPEIGTGAGFNLGNDLFTGLFKAWYTYEQADIAFDMKRAEIQQDRMLNAVNTDQQIDEYLYSSQGREGVSQKMTIGVVAAIAAALAVVLLK